MDVIIIFNGLGNQMSQYAFYMRKKASNNSTRILFDRQSSYIHNGYELNKVFNIPYKTSFSNSILYIIFRFLQVKRYAYVTLPLQKILGMLGIKLIVEQNNYDYNVEHLKNKFGIRFYFGGWHSEKYFKTLSEQVIDKFKFNLAGIEDHISRIAKEMHSINSISVHVRRGDFLSEVNKNTYGAVCSKQYFEKAIEKINSLIDSPHFYFFSNDVSWVKDNFQFENITIIDFNAGENSWKDMYLMSKCKHNINSNSTFSWWGAWLNCNDNKVVITPKFFINNLITKDFYPEDWINISDY